MRSSVHSNFEREEMEALCEFHQVPWLLEEFLDAELRYSEALEIVAANGRRKLSKMEVRKMANKTRSYDFLDLNPREVREYSFLRAIEAVHPGRPKKGCVELEYSKEIGNRYGETPKGIFIPRDIWGRDLAVGTDSAGGYTVGTDLLGDEFVDALRARLVTGRLGAQILSGLKGDVAIPGLSSGTSVYWVAENGTPTEGAPVFRQIQLTPKTLGTFIDVSRKLMLQSSPAVEGLVRKDLLAAILTEVDNVAINGGGANEPTGILQTAGIGSVALGTNGGAPTWASVVNLIKEVAIDNAMMGNLAYLSNPAAIAKLRTTAKVSSTDSVMIMDGENSLMGYPVEQTTVVPSNLTKGSGTDLCAMIFGNFSDLVIGQWGPMDVLVDPYTGGSSGITRIVGFMSVDVAVRHAESFSAIVDMITN